MSNTKQRTLLIILDGLGAAPKAVGNAVVLADAQNLSTLWNTCPHTYLLASGEAVGLPKNVKGNSEVGHMNLGSGRVISQNLPRINSAIENGLIYRNDTLGEAFAHAIQYKSRIHLVGLLSDGGVHSHIDHFKAVIDYFAKRNFGNDLFIHAFTDGRDTPTNVSASFMDEITEYCTERGIGKIGTFVGRYYAMDRNNKWDRTQKAYNLLVSNDGESFSDYKKAIDTYYSRGLTDEFLPPTVLCDSKIQANDVVIFLNFRADRMMQIVAPFELDDFKMFRANRPVNLFVAGMVEYRKDFPKKVLFPKQYINLTLGKTLELTGKRQLRISETEKYAHVTYFFNGGIPLPYEREDRINIPSPRVPTYDLKPEMSAEAITTTLVQKFAMNSYDFILVNFANADMVGHTGNLEAGIRAVKFLDSCVDTLVREFTMRGGAVLITADHGNAEEMINLSNGEVDTEHSLNPVPFILAGTDITQKGLQYGSLKDIAPTILDVMGIPIPGEMTGTSLIKGL